MLFLFCSSVGTHPLCADSLCGSERRENEGKRTRWACSVGKGVGCSICWSHHACAAGRPPLYYIYIYICTYCLGRRLVPQVRLRTLGKRLSVAVSLSICFLFVQRLLYGLYCCAGAYRVERLSRRVGRFRRLPLFSFFAYSVLSARRVRAFAHTPVVMTEKEITRHGAHLFLFCLSLSLFCSR